MHPAQIKAALEMHGVSQRDLAAQLGQVRPISETAIWLVIHGRSRSRRIENRIAVITGKALADIWPQWHGPNAKRRRTPMSAVQAIAALKAKSHAANV